MNLTRNWRLDGVLGTVLLVTLACGGGSPTSDHTSPAAPTCAAAAGLSNPVNDKGTALLASTGTVIVGDEYFSPTCLTGASGTVTLTFHNSGRLLHNFSVPEQNIDVDIPSGQTLTVKLTVSGKPVGCFCKYTAMPDRSARSSRRPSAPRGTAPRAAALGVPGRPRRKHPPVRRFKWSTAAWFGGGVAVLFGGLALLVASGINHPVAQQPIPSVAAGTLAPGQPAPDFTATTFDGHQLSLSSLRGQAVLINFFASWCTQCAHELPFMEQSYERHRAGGFEILGVNSLETGDGLGFYRRLGLTFPAVYDPGNPGKIALAYSVTSSLPVSVFVDKNGRVDLIQIGALTPDLLEQEIRKLS